MSLSLGVSPVPLINKGLVETHRIVGLEGIPSCLTYVPLSKETGAKLLIGDLEGGVTILEIDSDFNFKAPFLGRRKLRGTLAKIRVSDLRNAGKIRSYQAHQTSVKQVRFLGEERSLILSASRDKKFSLFCEDYTGLRDSFIISLPKVKPSIKGIFIKIQNFSILKFRE